MIKWSYNGVTKWSYNGVTAKTDEFRKYKKPIAKKLRK